VAIVYLLWENLIDIDSYARSPVMPVFDSWQ
jgi:hypothetical protein